MDTLEYWTFVLGYDLLHDNLKDTPCDEAFNICKSLAIAFMLSDYWENSNKSGYECLQDYLKDLKVKMESESD